jgi:hypothetical protein
MEDTASPLSNPPDAGTDQPISPTASPQVLGYADPIPAGFTKRAIGPTIYMEGGTNRAMGREDWIWIAMRIFGIYLLVLAVIEIPTLMQSAFQVVAYHKNIAFVGQQNDYLSQMMSTLERNSMSSLFGGTMRVIIYSLAGYYLLRRGKMLFKIMSRQ